jgi:ubiquinone/menaquinone biosynthesis C-methylase UbiE
MLGNELKRDAAVMEEEVLIHSEVRRIKAEYLRRESEVQHDLYAPWQPAEILMTSERKRIAATMLKSIGKFPVAGKRCLEVGYGKLGWLADALSWGLRSSDLYGIELDADRACQAQSALPGATLKIGDATSLPWRDDNFDYAIVSTVFSSILDAPVRNAIAREISRVLRTGGVVILYDIAMNNPGNKAVSRVKRSEIRSMFSGFDCHLRSVTLAPPIARLVAPRSWALANVLSGIPVLRTHLIGVLVKR